MRIELRWLTRDTGAFTAGFDANGDYTETLPIRERVLQFRVVTGYWDGDWADVPETDA